MNKIIASYPFESFYVYKVFHKKENRFYACLVNINNHKVKKTTSWARYVYQTYHKIILNKNIHVDHIDNNPLNDDINNLQEISQSKNNKKYTDEVKGITYVECKCPNCEKIFIKEKHKTHLIKKGYFTSCSRKCSGIISHKLNTIDLSNNIIKIFNA